MPLNKFKLHRILLVLFLSIWAVVAQAEQQTNPLPIFDAHIHYSHDVWDAISAKDAIRRLKAAGVKRATVSSSSDDGTHMLYQEDPRKNRVREQLTLIFKSVYISNYCSLTPFSTSKKKRLQMEPLNTED